MHDPSAGEIGGLFAGLVALLAVVGRGLRWWLGWTDRHAASRAAKLDAWQQELGQRERRFDERQREYEGRIELELDALRAADRQRGEEMASLKIEHAALRTAHQLISSALRRTDPYNPALGQAEEILKAAFPPDAVLPADIADSINKIA
jgi:hypothetical protein